MEPNTWFSRMCEKKWDILVINDSKFPFPAQVSPANPRSGHLAHPAQN